MNNAKLRWKINDALKGEIVGINASPYDVTTRRVKGNLVKFCQRKL